MTNITIQDFHQDIAAAEEASKQGPVLITEDGQPKHILLTFSDFQELEAEKQPVESTGEITKGSLWDWLHSMPAQPEDLADYDFPTMGASAEPAECK